MEKFQKKDIKKVKIEDEKLIVSFEKEIQMDKKQLFVKWKILKEREYYLILEKEKLKEIAKQANIKLE